MGAPAAQGMPQVRRGGGGGVLRLPNSAATVNMLAPLALKGSEREALPMTICDNYLFRNCGNVLYGSLFNHISVLVKIC